MINTKIIFRHAAAAVDALNRLYGRVLHAFEPSTADALCCSLPAPAQRC